MVVVTPDQPDPATVSALAGIARRPLRLIKADLVADNPVVLSSHPTVAAAQRALEDLPPELGAWVLAPPPLTHLILVAGLSVITVLMLGVAAAGWAFGAGFAAIGALSSAGVSLLGALGISSARFARQHQFKTALARRGSAPPAPILAQTWNRVHALRRKLSAADLSVEPSADVRSVLAEIEIALTAGPTDTEREEIDDALGALSRAVDDYRSSEDAGITNAIQQIHLTARALRGDSA